MERGTLFIWLFFAIAPTIAILLLVRGIRRAWHGSARTRTILATLGFLGLWLFGSHAMLAVVFATAYGLAHTRPFPPGLFPEGWIVYGCLAAYAAWGAMLIRAQDEYPRMPESK